MASALLALPTALTASRIADPTLRSRIEASGTVGPSAAIPGLTTALISDTLLTLDSNNPASSGPSNGYHGVRFTNSGSTTIQDLRATLALTGTGFALAGSPVAQRATLFVGSLAPGQSRMVYWYISYPRTIGATGTATVTMTDATLATAARADRLIT